MEELNRIDVREDNFDWKSSLTKTYFLDFPDYHVCNDRRINFRFSCIGFNLFKTVCSVLDEETTTVFTEIVV